jgi:energy-coupling factor transport system substrate-specific component
VARPGVLGALIVRKRGAAVYSALVAALVSALLGTPWGLSVVLYGLVQGALPELVFALVLYRSWGLATSSWPGPPRASARHCSTSSSTTRRGAAPGS